MLLVAFASVLHCHLFQLSGLILEIILNPVDPIQPVHIFRILPVCFFKDFQLCLVIFIHIPDGPGTGIPLRARFSVINGKLFQPPARFHSGLLKPLPLFRKGSSHITRKGQALLLHRRPEGQTAGVLFQDASEAPKAEPAYCQIGSNRKKDHCPGTDSDPFYFFLQRNSTFFHIFPPDPFLLRRLSTKSPISPHSISQLISF